MNIGVPKEVRPFEFRVGLTPPAVDALVRAGHTVFVERGAGRGAGFPDTAYEAVGARVVYTHEEAYGRAEVVVKVARPTAEEYGHFRQGQVILSFLHLAVASPDLLAALQEHQVTAIAYETMQTPDGTLPVLHPTSVVAGRMAPLIAGQLLETMGGGRGILLSGIPGVPPAAVVVLGGGVVGTNAACAFHGLGAQVTVLDRDIRALQRLDTLFKGHIATMMATPYNVAKAVAFADVLVGAVAVPGERAPPDSDARYGAHDAPRSGHLGLFH
ncbi:MAG: NAD-binding protein [Ardenticatenia bacterium]|nr:NAD-binding protein [Ardenticatenia bacterium]